MKELKTIYLAWRKGRGSSRIIVGKITRDLSGTVTFSYDKEGVLKAQKDGFTAYTDFPDTSRKYSENVVEIFGQRLIKPERNDFHKYLDFWEVKSEYRSDKFKLLAFTQGMMPTDNFEFLADFDPEPGLILITEVCGLTDHKFPAGFLSAGDLLLWKKEPGNSFDRNAIQVYKGDTLVGYVKHVHSGMFYKDQGENLRITVKSFDQNGIINRIFIRVSC